MLGYAIQKSHGYSWPPATHKSMDKKGLLDTAGETAPAFMALVRDGDKVKRLDFVNNQGKAVKEFNAVCGEGKKYKVGALTRNLGTVSAVATASALEFEHYGHDVYELWTNYLQQQGHYKKVSHTEADAGMLTVAERTRIRKANLAKLDADIKDMKSEQLFQNYYFEAVFVRKDTGALALRGIGHHRSLDAAAKSYRNQAAAYINTDQPFTSVFYSREGGAFYCSDGDMEQLSCQRALGYALRAYRFKRGPVTPSKRVYFDYSTPDHEARFFAIVKDTKTEEVKKYNLTMRDQGKAQRQFNKLTKEENKIGALGYSHRSSARWVQYKSSSKQYADLDVALAQFAQRRLGMFKGKFSLAAAELLTTKARAAELKATKDAYLKGADANKKFRQSVEAFRASQPGLASRYAQAIRYSVFSVRIGSSYNTNFQRQFRIVNKAAWSYAGLLKGAANRLLAVSNVEVAQAKNARRVAKDRYGRAETIAGNFEHIVVLGLGTPKVLFTSHNLTASANSQALLGWIWRNLDPSGARHRWFMESRADILKYHAWKYTAAQAPTEDKKDYFKSFAVFEDRDSGKFTVETCAGTESSNKAADVAKASKACVAQFQKDVNPVRSEKNVRGFFISGTQFIFSKYEDTRDGNDMNKGEIPA